MTDLAGVSADEKAVMRRAARAAATERERARRAGLPKPAPRPCVVVPPPLGLAVSARCEEGEHPYCARVFSCECPCHQRVVPRPPVAAALPRGFETIAALPD